MSARRWNISLLVCDDVREERSRKQIFVGCYGEVIRFESVPVRYGRLVFAVILQGDLRELLKATLEIVIYPPEHDPLVVPIPPDALQGMATEQASVEGDWWNVRFIVPVMPFPVMAVGNMRVTLKIDGLEELAGKIRVETGPIVKIGEPFPTVPQG